MPQWITGKFEFSVCCASLFCFLLTALVPPVLQAQSDTPVIDLHEIQQGVAGEVQVFTVEIDNVDNLAAVDFMYRQNGETDYQASPMKLLEGTSVFTVYIDTNASDPRAIEYYIQALDNSGGRIVKGFTFEPFVRTLSAPELVVDVAAAEDPNTSFEIVKPSEQVASEAADQGALATAPAERSSSSKKWLWGIAGLVVVVALASSLSGDSDDDDDSDPLSLQVKNNSQAVFNW